MSCRGVIFTICLNRFSTLWKYKEEKFGGLRRQQGAYMDGRLEVHKEVVKNGVSDQWLKRKKAKVKREMP